MKRYYKVEFNDFGYGEIFNKYNISYNGFKLEKSDYNFGEVYLYKRRIFSERIVKSIVIPIIIEYDDISKKYFDIITGEEYVETGYMSSNNLYKCIVNRGGCLELCLRKYEELSSNRVADELKKLTPFEINAYFLAMDNLKKAAGERVEIINKEKRDSENFIESFKSKNKTYRKNK